MIKALNCFIHTIPFPSPGFIVPTLLANVGDMTNKGAELNLNYDYT